jgi:hypothetical protein
MPSGLIEASFNLGGSGGAVDETIKLLEYSLDARQLTIGPSLGKVLLRPL